MEVPEYGGWSNASGDLSTRACMYLYDASTDVSIATKRVLLAKKPLSPSLSCALRKWSSESTQTVSSSQFYSCAAACAIAPAADLTFSKNHCAALVEPADRAARSPSEDPSDRTRKTAAIAQPQPH